MSSKVDSKPGYSFPGMSLKLFLQLGIIGAKIAGRVVADTTRQAFKSISKNVSSNNVRTSSSQMELDEALKILNVTKDTPKEEMAQRFQKIFELNDRRTGGSFYLQSKIVRARERLEAECEKRPSKPSSN